MYFDQTHEALRTSVRKFVDKEINPHMDEWEEKTVPLHDLFKKMGSLGFLGIRYAPEYGGQGLDYWFETAYLEELGHIQGLGTTIAIIVQSHLATPAIDMFGSEYLKEVYLKPALQGDVVSAVAVTEPGAGSDVFSIKSKAVRKGDHYVLNGSKTFITNGCQADFLTLLARTSDENNYHAFGLFVVPTKLHGFNVGKKLDKLGMRSSDTAELYFDNVKVPAENLIGKEGEGFIYQMKQFQHERFSLMPVLCTWLTDLIEMTIDYIKQRVVFGEPLISKQVLRHRLVEWLTEIECLRHLTYHIVRMKMENRDVTREVTMAKLYVGKISRQIADGCLQMHGGMGYMNETLVSRYYRDARIVSIGGGADEVMADVLARMYGF